MTRRKFTLDANTLTLPVSLDFQAQALTVYNPTPNLVAVRIGSTAIPSSALTADVWIGPYAAETYPVEGVSFGLVLLPVRAGAALSSDALLPPIVLVTFTANEAAPVYNQVDFSLLGATEALIVNQAARAAGNYVDGPYAVPSWARSLVVRKIEGDTTLLAVQASPSNTTLVQLTGNTAAEQTDLVQAEPWLPWMPATDSAIGVVYNCTGVDNGYEIRASRYAYEPGSRDLIGGYARVDVLPHGAAALPVSGTVAVTGLANPLPVSMAQQWPNVPAPAAALAAFAAAPAAGTVILVTAALAAGDYRIECDLGSSDLPAVNKFVSFRWNAGAKGAIIHPCGGGTARIVWSRVTVAAGDTFDVATGAVAAAGSVYSGAIRAYKIA